MNFLFFYFACTARYVIRFVSQKRHKTNKKMIVFILGHELLTNFELIYETKI